MASAPTKKTKAASSKDEVPQKKQKVAEGDVANASGSASVAKALSLDRFTSKLLAKAIHALGNTKEDAIIEKFKSIEQAAPKCERCGVSGKTVKVCSCAKSALCSKCVPPPTNEGEEARYEGSGNPAFCTSCNKPRCSKCPEGGCVDCDKGYCANCVSETPCGEGPFCERCRESFISGDLHYKYCDECGLDG